MSRTINKNNRIVVTAVFMVLLVSVLVGLPAKAAIGAQPNDIDGENSVPVTSRLQVPLERNIQKRFDEFDQLLQKKDVRSIDVLVQLLELSYNGFIRNDGRLLGLHSQIEQRIEAMPVELRQRYLQRVQFAANNALVDDSGNDEMTHLLQIVRRYRGTRAAFAALKKITDRRFDRGQLLLAAVGYQRLLSNPLVSKKEKPSILLRLLLSLQQTEQTSAALIAIEEHGTAWRSLLKNASMHAHAATQVQKWLSEAERQKAEVISEPGEKWGRLSSVPQWSVPRGIHGSISMSPHIHERMKLEENAARKHGAPFIPVFRPTVKGGRVFVSLGTSVESLSVIDGKSHWNTPVSSRWSDLLVSLGSIAGLNFQNFPTMNYVEQIQADSGLENLCCEHDHVYKVVEKVNSSQNKTQHGFSTQRRSAAELPVEGSLLRQLAAFDIETGKQLWKSAPTIELSYDDVHSSALRQPLKELIPVKIQCAPLVFDRQLLTLGESKSQLWLLSIDPETGKHLWSLALGTIDKDDSHFMATRHIHKPLKVVNGLLICPVGMGTVVAIDLVERRPVWTTYYSQDALERPLAQPIPNGKMQRSESYEKSPNSWRESQLVVGKKLAIVASPESRAVSAFQLIDGKPLWSWKVGHAIQLIDSSDDQLLAVSRSNLQSIDVDTGQVLWSTAIDAPVGDACVAGEHVLVPLETGYVASIEIATGKKKQSLLKASVALGNLTFANDAVYSQTMAHVSKYVPIRSQGKQTNATFSGGDQGTLDTIRLAIEQNYWNEARRQLKEFSQTKPELPLAEVWDILTAELRQAESPSVAAIHDFDSWMTEQGDVFEKQKLISEEYERRGELDKARSIWHEMAHDLNSSQAMFDLTPVHSVGAQRWAMAKLMGSTNPFAKTDWLSPAGEQPSSHRFLGEQFKLLRQVDRLPSQKSVAKLHELAQFMENYSYPLDARAYRQQADRLQAMFDQRRHRQNLNPSVNDLPWPIKFDAGEGDKFEVKRNRSQGDHWTLIPVQSLEGTLLNRLTFWLSGKRDLIRFDSIHHSGNWTLKLPKPKQKSGARLPILQGWAVGHLLMVQVGNELMALSAFNERGEPNASLVWHRALTTKNSEVDNTGAVAWQLHQPHIGWGPPSVTFLNRFDFAAGRIGPVTSSYVCYRDAGTLIAISPLTGQTMWERSDIDVDTKIVGDQNKIALISAQGQSQIFLRSFDGAQIARHRNNVRPGDIVKNFGLNVVTIRSDDGKTTLACTDLASDSVVWERQLNDGQMSFDWNGGNSRGNEYIGLFDKQGWLTAIDGRSGETLFRHKVEKQPDITHIAAFSDPYLNYVIVSSTPNNIQNASLQKGRLGLRTVVSTGKLYAISKFSGQPIWSRDLHEQGLPLDQPPESPFLLSFYLRQQIGSDPAAEANEWHFECIDKQTGAILARSNSSLGERRISYHWESRNSSGIDLHFADKTVHFPLTNK